VIPGAVALIAAALLARRRGGAWFALASALGYVAGHVALFGFARLYPKDAASWTVWIVVVAAGAAEVARRADIAWLRWSLWTILCAGTPALLLRSMIVHEWTPVQTTLHLTALGASLLAMIVLTGGGRNVNDPIRPSVWLLVALALPPLLKMTGSLRFGELGGVTTACITGPLIVAFFRREHSAAAAAAGVVTLMIGSLLISGVYLSSTTSMQATLIGLAMLMSSSRLRPQEWAGTWRVGWASRLVWALVLIAMAVGTAAAAFIESQNSAAGDLPY